MMNCTETTSNETMDPIQSNFSEESEENDIKGEN